MPYDTNGDWYEDHIGDPGAAQPARREGETPGREQEGGFTSADSALRNIPILGPAVSDLFGISEESEREKGDRQRRAADYELRNKYAFDTPDVYDDATRARRADDLRQTSQADVARQMAALQQLTEAGKGGADAIDAANMRGIRQNMGQAQAHAARQGAAAQQASGMRGVNPAVGTAGLAGAAGAVGQSSTDAQMRALQMLRARGQMASAMRRQDFGETMNQAQARDATMARDADYRYGVRGANVDRRNRQTAERAGLTTGMADTMSARAGRQKQQDADTIGGLIQTAAAL